MTSVTSDYVSGLGLTGYGAQATSKGDDALGQDEFLKLMLAQLNNQDPTDPLKNEDFVAQLAQFSTVSGIEQLSSAFTELSSTLSQNQTLQAASLVGNKVLVPAQSAVLEAGQGLSGAISLGSSAGSVTVDVYGPAGDLVRTLELGTLGAGLHEIAWDGLLEDGEPAPAGTYSLKVSGQSQGVTTAIESLIDGQVQSVTFDSDGGGLMLNLLGLGTVSFSDVLRIE